MTRYWQDGLHKSLVLEVIKRIDKLRDYLSFEAICKSWQVTEFEYLQWLKCREEIPYLILEGDGEERAFCSITKEEVVGKIKRPCLKDRRCLESLGWLLTVGLSGDLTLLNPITGFEIELPPQQQVTWSYFHDIIPVVNISKMILSSRPDESADFAVIIIKEGDLSFWRSGDSVWNHIQRFDIPIYDITYFNDKLYAIDSRENILEFDLTGSDPGQERIVVQMYEISRIESYICEFSGELFVIFKDYGEEEEEEGYIFYVRFYIYKVNISSGRWEAMQSLGSKSLFTGQNQTKLIDISKFGKFKGNCVYHTKNTSCETLQGNWVFNLETKEIETIYQGEEYPPCLQQSSPALWCFCPPI